MAGHRGPSGSVGGCLAPYDRHMQVSGHTTAIATTAAPSADRVERAIPKAAQREAARLMDAWRTEHGVPGIAVSIRDAGAPVLDIASGVANVRSGRELTTSDRMFAASTTKMGTAALVLRLAEQGRLDLDSKLAQWFPQIPHAKEITVRSLLKHRSGVPSADRAQGSPAHWDIAKGPGNAWSRERMVDFLATHDVRGKPGQKWEYSNGGYTLLEMIVERQTGQPFEEVFERELLEPVGARRASIDMGAGGDPTTVAEYMDFGTGLGLTNHDSVHGKGGVLRSIIPGGAGGLVTSAPELAKYAEGLLWKRGTTLSSSSREELLRSTENRDSYGYGLAKYGDNPWDKALPKSYGHGGRTLGGLAEVLHLPRTQQTLVALTNLDTIPGGAMTDLLHQLRGVLRKHGVE